ncbi:MAG: CDP-diacylglycerol--serine O-phosphatidyltransferase [Bacteroidales bacterium]|nr:CDP-diacylglycerol--serine O-phosphatidyltransferase [Bacteroidales bacterium]
MKIDKHIANAVTCINILCGCFAVISLINRELWMASYFVYLAVIFDFIDGFVARALNVKSEFGKQLDSLADAISFGLVPGILMYRLIFISISISNINISPYFACFGFLITVFSLLRLAKYNLDIRQEEHFIGLPTPANAIFIMSFPLILQNPYCSFFSNEYLFIVIILNPIVLISLTFIVSALLISEIPLFALKFKTFSLKENKLVYSFLFISIILLAIFYFIAIPMITILYIILSLFNNISKSKKNHEIQS